MCKVLMVAGVKDSNREKVWKFVKAMAKPMSDSNRDGLGYSAIGADGNVFGERWLNNDQAFRKFVKSDKLNEKILKDLDGAVEVVGVHQNTGEVQYNTFGDVRPDKAVAITLHTRMATSAKGMINVHPFVYKGVSLIHNGVIRNTEDFTFKVSTCDSESILLAYLEQQVKDNPDNLSKAAGMLRGYYACGVLANTEQGPILDVFKDTSARLHAVYVEELETYVFSTDDTDLKNVCREFGYNISTMLKIRGGKLIRLNAITGEKQLIQDFNCADKPYTPYYSQHSPTTSSTSNSGTNSSGNTTDSVGTGSTRSLPSGRNGTNVYPLNKHNVDANDKYGLLAYHTAGRPRCVKISERSIQEEIMNMDRSSRM